VSVHAYGTAIRSVQMTRGNRQGNNAFLQDANWGYNDYSVMQSEQLRPYLTVKLMENLFKLQRAGDIDPFQNVAY
jgi:hypothetical protein